jgi:hypothetical protein
MPPIPPGERPASRDDMTEVLSVLGEVCGSPRESGESYSSLVAVVVELHNVGALLDALQLVEFFVQNVASGADVV